MVIWGAIWGLILGFLWPGHDSDAQAVIGAVGGAIAGFSLRRVVRREIETQRAKWGAAPPKTAGSATPIDGPISGDEPVPEPRPDTTGAALEPVRKTMAQVEAEMEAGVPLASSLPGAETAPADLPPPAPAASQPGFATVLLDRAKAWLLGGNTIVRMGVLVLFVGLAFLAKFAIDNALLPPELRLAGIALAGIALFATGFWLRGKRPGRLAYALTLQGAGVGVLYLTVFAAFRLYQFLPGGAAFVLLALICAFSAAIALAQNAMAMAFIGFAGGFAAPILLSTGQGNHVSLFSYYLLLNIAIAGIAWAKAWRPLNLLGFFATFGVATAWGALKYQPEQFASTEPFLVAFFLIYVVASLLYALRHSLAAKQAVDATLVFGTPLVAFGLQVGLVREMAYAAAFSSLVLGAFYLVLGWTMIRRKGSGASGGEETGRWLAECFAALGLGFVTLAIPLALDARWTSAVWAAEGAAVYWMGRRQERWLARAAGLVLQVLAAGSYLNAIGHGPDPQWALANPVFIGAVLLAASAWAIAWWARDPTAASSASGPKGFAELERGLSPVLFWVGFLWWQFGLSTEITRAPPNTQGSSELVFGHALQAHLHMLAWLMSAFVFSRLALPVRAQPWRIAATPAWFTLPVMFLAALYGMLEADHVFKSWGWAAWPLALLLHALMLRSLDQGAPRPWWPWVHAGGVWLLVLLAGNLLVFAVGKADLWQTAWATVILLVAGIAVLLALARRVWFDATSSSRQHWPLDRFARAYLWLAAAPLALGVALGCLVVAVHSNGNARPLPYIPLLNPTDLSIALGLAACALWLMRVRTATLDTPMWARHTRLPMGLVAIAFVAINTVWLRVAHQVAGVPWNAQNLFDSFLVQAGYSILWTLLALGLMVAAYRRSMRAAWMLGAVLLGATVVKLFVIDLSNRGGSERIFVFIAVGILMLVVGYFAPIPPAQPMAVKSDPEEVKV